MQLKRLEKRWEVNFAITAWLVKKFDGTRIIDVIIIDLWKPFKVTTLDRKRAKLDDYLRPSYSKQTEEATPHLPTSRRDFQWVPVEQKESKYTGLEASIFNPEAFHASSLALMNRPKIRWEKQKETNYYGSIQLGPSSRHASPNSGVEKGTQ